MTKSLHLKKISLLNRFGVHCCQWGSQQVRKKTFLNLTYLTLPYELNLILRDRSCILQGGSHSYYKPDRVPYYSNVNREQIAVETANESGFRSLGETSDVSPDGVRQDILTPISAGTFQIF